MPMTMGLSDGEAQAIANRVLGQFWHDAGFDAAEVRSGRDHDGDPALFVTAILKAASPAIPAAVYAHALVALDDAMRAQGEERFAYVQLSRPDDPIDDVDNVDGL